MNRRQFFAALTAPFLARLMPKPAPRYGLFNPKADLALQYREAVHLRRVRYWDDKEMRLVQRLDVLWGAALPGTVFDARIVS